MQLLNYILELNLKHSKPYLIILKIKNPICNFMNFHIYKPLAEIIIIIKTFVILLLRKHITKAQICLEHTSNNLYSVEL